MNILHNVEAVFALVAAVAVSAGALLPTHDIEAAAPREVSVATPTRMAVVKVSAQRLTAVQKMRSLEDERALARQATSAPPRG
jgi:hypothetical protein